MKLSMWDILNALPYDNITPMLQAGSATIEKARLIASSYLDEHTVYAGAANNYFEAEEEDTIIVHRSDMILVRGVGTENVFDEICTIIERFRFWENELAMLVDHDRGLQKMLDCSKDILKTPCFVYAPDGHAYAISDDYPREIHWHWAEILDNGGITSDRMRTLRDSINLPDVWKDTFPKKRDSRMGSHQYMHCSLYPNGYMAGHLVLFGFSKPFDKGTERIVNVLAKYMTRHMKAFYSQYSPTSRLAEPFSALLSQGVFADEEISLSLRALRWSIDDTYRVYVFEERGEREPVLLSQLLSAISSQYPLAVPFALDEQLVVPDLHLAQRVAVDDRRHGKHLATVIGQEGVFVTVLENPAEVLALGVGLDDLTEGTLLGVLQGDEACLVRVGGGLVDGPLDFAVAVDSHGNGLALAAEVPAELLLGLDDVEQLRLAYRLAREDKCDQVGADALERGIDRDQAAARVLGLVLRRKEGGVVAAGSPLVLAEATGQPARGPEVGAVGVVQLYLDDPLVLSLVHVGLLVQLGLGEGQLFLEGVPVVFFSQQMEEEFLVYFNLWHAIPLWRPRLSPPGFPY